MLRRFPVLLTLFACALALAACGGGGDSAAEGEITETIETVATGSQKSNCTKLETLKFTEQTTGQVSRGAPKACEEEAGKEQAKGVEVSDISVDGKKATANVVFEGGGYDGQGLEVALIEEGGTWKLDEAVKFTEFDKAVLVRRLEKALNEPQSGLNGKQAACVVKALEGRSQGDFEALLLHGEVEVFEELTRGCA